MNTIMQEIMPQMFDRSEYLIWNFSDITELDNRKNIQKYMEDKESEGLDPRLAFHRQEFNNRVLKNSKSRYLIGRYCEDRKDIIKGSHIAKEGRTYHLAIDIFSKEQEIVSAPCNGEIVRSDYEPGLHNYGNYLILRPEDSSLPFIFFGHLANDKHELGPVKAGQPIGKLGSYEKEENGGWSIHLHLQLLTKLPKAGETPIGYSSFIDLKENQKQFPNPMSIFPQWSVKR